MEHISQKHGNAILLETCNDTFFVFILPLLNTTNLISHLVYSSSNNDVNPYLPNYIIRLSYLSY